MVKQVVRVATTNNFNCTSNEWNQLAHFVEVNPDKVFFVNCNIKTPKLNTVNAHNHKVVVTANPNLVITQSEIPTIISRLEGIKDRVAFVRVKYLPDNQVILNLLGEILTRGFKVVMTLQRFNGKKTLTKYTSLEYYTFSCSRYRLSGQALDQFNSFIKDLQDQGSPVWICDQSGTGCQGCGLCSKLTTGENFTVTSLNLSTSGVCPYACPDCYAKTMQEFAKKLGHKLITYDTIRQNDKQAGRTAHIKEAKAS